MTRYVLFDQIHIDIRVPERISGMESGRIRKTLNRPAFQIELRRAIRAVIRKRLVLAALRIAVSR